MSNYYVNKNAQSNGDHEVHTAICNFLPNTENRIYLGSHNNCASAVKESRKHYTKTNGCYYCCKECHTS